MAIKLQLTDDKGVITRYHAVKSYELKDGKLVVKVKSWVNSDTRDAERITDATNDDAKAYDAETEALRLQLDALSRKFASGDKTIHEELVALSNQINDRALSTDRPIYLPVADRCYSEKVVVMDYFEPLTLEAIYNKLTAEGGDFAGAEQV